MSLRILIIDDEPAIVRALQPILVAKGCHVRSAASGVEGLRIAQEDAAELVLLDLGLPDMDGKELIPALRSSSDLAIIIISARHQETEKVHALDAGADDYVDKPFRVEELLARIRAAERRLKKNRRDVGIVTAGDLRIDRHLRRVTLLGQEIRLSPKEYQLLGMLADHAGQVVTQRKLLLAGWGDPGADSQYLRTYIGLLRQKLEADPSEPKIVVTEAGVGYRLNV